MVMLGEASYSMYLIHMLIYFNFMGSTPLLPETGLVIVAMMMQLAFCWGSLC
jgi:peptidoglycan/LPS O-acetylase OafA/YrhL